MRGASAGALALVSPEAPPDIARRLRIGMPHLDAGGLSESWLLRYAGDLCWEEISRRLRALSDEIRGVGGERLYPTFLAVRTRHDVPLCAVRENDVLDAAVEVVPCGRALAHGRVTAVVRGHRLSLELVSAFARREGSGDLRMTVPAARLAARWRPATPLPAIARLAQAARRRETLDDPALAAALVDAPALGVVRIEPSPYADYNGAGLLYFAAYVSLADTALRQLVRARRLFPPDAGDWALATSPVRRDVFYYANLPLGEALDAELLRFERDGDGAGVTTRVRLCRASDGKPMGDVITHRTFVEARR
jgi:probable biosynthetic protein (TIGR04098 family)